MRRLQGGRHRDRIEQRRRMLLTIPAVFGLAAAATSLWALGSPLDGLSVSDDAPTTATIETTAAEGATSPENLSEPTAGDAGIRTQEAEEAPTTEAAETTTEESAEEDEGGSEGDGESNSSPYADVEAAVADLVDAERDGAGCDPLERDSRLDTAARLHAEDMAANDYFDHTSQDGRSPSDRAAEQGYEGGVGENIAMGYPDAEAVMEGWMDSEGHRANILNCDYNVVGIGVADRDGTLYWVQAFG